MRNSDQWKESIYVLRRGRLEASSDPNEVGIASRLISTLTARTVQDALNRNAKGRLLDLGCGSVPYYGAYRDWVSEVTCVDWANTLHGNKYLDKEADLTKPLDFPDNSFDTVILSDVLEHIPIPLDLCREISRILSPRGKFIMNVPFFYWLHETPHDYHRYTEYALQRFMDESGLIILELKTFGGAIEIVSDILSKNLMSIPKLGRFAAAALQRSSLWFYDTKIGHRIAENTSKQFPQSYLVIAEKP